MWRLALGSFIVFVLVRPGWPVSQVEELERLLKEDRLEELEEKLRQIDPALEDHPTVLYLKGIFERNGLEAFHYFEQVVERHQNSAYADDALLRIAQYFYVQGKYDLARKYFSLLSRRFTHSPIKDDAQYLYCQSLLAQEKDDSARVFLQAFIENAPRSPFVDLAVMDLEALSSTEENGLAAESVQPVKPAAYRYTLQVGAFSNKRNARRLAKKFRELGHDTEIVAKRIGGKTLYAVWVGKFETRNLAQDYGERLLRHVAPNYRIVDRTKY